MRGRSSRLTARLRNNWILSVPILVLSSTWGAHYYPMRTPMPTTFGWEPLWCSGSGDIPRRGLSIVPFLRWPSVNRSRLVASQSPEHETVESRHLCSFLNCCYCLHDEDCRCCSLSILRGWCLFSWRVLSTPLHEAGWLAGPPLSVSIIEYILLMKCWHINPT